jgi:ribose-phosphate pyrophosphokinase
MIDTGGTFAQAAYALERNGAREIYGCATHALLSASCTEKLSQAPFVEVCVTNTVHIPEERKFRQLVVLPISDLLSKAIKYNHEWQSVSSLFPE